MGEWQRSSSCSSNSCVEARPVTGDLVEMRQVRDGVTRAWWVLDRDEYDAFIAGCKAGDFDLDPA